MKIDLTYLFKSLLIALIAFITPIKWLLAGVCAMVILDTLAGLYRAYKLQQDVTSKRFGHIISKFFLYNLAIISGYILQLMFGVDVLPFAKIIACAIGLTEMKSITENVSEVTGIDLWKFIMNYLKRNPDELSKAMDDATSDQTQKENPSK